MTTALPQGPIVSGSSVVLATVFGGAVYVYKSNGFQLASSPGDPLVFTVTIIENYIMLTTGSQSLLVDNLGKVTVGSGTASKIYMNNSQYTPISSTTLLASVLYEPSSIWVGTTTLMPLEFTIGTPPQEEVLKIALLPTTYYSTGCTPINSVPEVLALFAASQGIGTRSTNKAWTTLELCRAGVTFEYCSAGTRCTGNCYSGCTGTQVCSRNASGYVCKGTERVVTRTQVVEDPPPRSHWYIWLIAIVAFIVLAFFLYYFLWDDDTPAVVNNYSSSYVVGRAPRPF